MAGMESLLKLGSDISGLATGLNQSKELISSFANTIKGAMDTVVQMVESGIQALIKFGKKIMELGTASARFDSMRDSFNKMSAEFGATGQQLVAAMGEATQGMLKDSEMISSGMTAMMLISKEAMGDVTETLPMMAKIATAASRALGTSVDYMFGSIARGIGRASPMILDNLGMIIKLTDVYDAAADALGKTRKELTTVEKQTALVNEVMRQGNAYVENLGISTGGLATKQKQLTTNLANFRDVMGQAVMPMVQALQGLWAGLANTVIERVIPAFRTLARVLSEVLGMPNPFERWTVGDSAGETPADKTVKRINALKDGLASLIESGSDYLGEVTDANERFNDAVLELETEKFGPRLAKIQSEVTERIATIWADYNRSRARKDEDNKREDIRSAEAHKERLMEIENRYNDQISDAIRNRDARALLNLMRRQATEKSETKKQFADDQEKRDEDRTIERRRAEEDANLRVTQAKDAAAKQSAAVIAEAEKEIAKLAEIRDKEIDAAQKGYEAEVKAYEDKIHAQNKLLAQQIIEESAMRRELEKPLPPIWEKVAGILTIVWDKLQKIAGAITAIVEDPSLSNIMEQLGLDPDFLDRAGTKFGEIRDWLLDAKDRALELWDAIMKIIGPEFVIMWEDLKLAWEELKPLFPIIMEFFKEFAPFILGAVVLALGLLIAALRGVIAMIAPMMEFSVNLFGIMFGIASGIMDVLKGLSVAVAGLFHKDSAKFLRGVETFNEGVTKIFGGMWDLVIALFTGSIETIIKAVEGFFGSLVGIFTRLQEALVGHSIIPDMLNDITAAFGTFFINATQKWSDGWNGFVTIVQNIWGTISGIVDGFVSGISEKVGGWVSGVAETVEKVTEPARRQTGNYGYNAAGASNFNANNWNIYASGREDSVAEQAYKAVTDVFSGSDTMSQWRRK